MTRHRLTQISHLHSLPLADKLYSEYSIVVVPPIRRSSESEGCETPSLVFVSSLVKVAVLVRWSRLCHFLFRFWDVSSVRSFS